MFTIFMHQENQGCIYIKSSLIFIKPDHRIYGNPDYFSFLYSDKKTVSLFSQSRQIQNRKYQKCLSAAFSSNLPVGVIMKQQKE